MENIILGLLLLSDRTIYQLRERIHKGMHFMYSGSTGSIQAAIKKLLRLGYIAYQEMVENGKYKKIYSITESGKQYFFDWVNAPLENANIKSPELVKIYFMGFSDKQTSVKNIESYLELLKCQHETLCAVCQEGENAGIPAEGREIFKFQDAAARYGRDFLEFNIQWYEKLKEALLWTSEG